MDTEVRTQNTGVTSSTPAQPFIPATLPYWDWTTNSAGTGPMTALPDLVSTPTIIDPMSGISIQNPFYNAFIPGLASTTVRNPLPADLFGNPTFLSRVLASLTEPTFAQFSNQLNQNYVSINDKKSFSIEIERVETFEKKEIS